MKKETKLITIKEFKGLRPKKELYEKIVAPPYDVLSYQDCVKLKEESDISLVRITRSEIDCPLETDPYSKIVYEKAKQNLDEYIKNGYLQYDKTPSLYIYRQEMGKHKQIGFVAVVSIYEYEKGLIKKHENTRKDKEEDRIKHIDITNTQIEPVFLAYQSPKKELDDFLSKIEKRNYEIKLTTDDNVTHTLWIIDDKTEIDFIKENFKNIDSLYIADGHHRTKAALEVAKKRDKDNKNDEDSEYRYVLSVIFPENMLKIMAYNRLVKDLNGLSIVSFLEKLNKNFKVSKIASNEKDGGFSPLGSHTIGMYINNDWYLLIPNFISDDPVKSLDVSILQDYILDEILDIKDPRTDKRIDFVGGIKGSGFLKNKVDSDEFKIAFSMYPTSMNELLNVASHNMLMPPKSTWFEPKLKSGIFLHSLD